VDLAGNSSRFCRMPGRDLTVDGDPVCVPLARARSPAAVRRGSLVALTVHRPDSA
jgi:hypothetical protein